MNSTRLEPLVIVSAADERYIMPLAAMIKSALTTLDTRRAVLLYVIDAGIHDEDKQRSLHSWVFDHLTVQWVQVDSRSYSHLPVWGRMRSTTYARLLMPDVLPRSFHKALWLDCDLIVKRNLAEVWETDMGDHAVLAVQDMVVPYVSSRYGIAPYKELGMARDAKYFNTGVMVVNLDRWRQHDVTSRVLAYLRQYRKTMCFWDQEGLNAVLVGQWGELDPRWNQIASVSGRSFFTVEHLDQTTYQHVVRDPWIVHFAGFWKPWIYHNQNPSRALYFRYVDMTAWAGWRPRKTVKSIIMGLYESRLRDVLYPAEKWGMALLRKGIL